MRRTVVAFFVFIFAISLSARQLTDSSRISLITATAGDELYSTFGHSGIRIYDSSLGIDVVFNYGTFDFNTPNFYLKFTRGKLNYMLSVEDFGSFIESLSSEKRIATEQVFNFNQAQKQKLFDLLIENYRPENRFYKYDFFYDNCATRIRDIVSKTLDNKIIIKENNIVSKLKFRELIKPCFANMPWSRFGTDILLGLPTDKVAGQQNAMFLPDKMFDAYANATIDGKFPLISETKVLNPGIKQALTPPMFFNPLLFGYLLLLISILSLLNKTTNAIFDYSFFSLVGFLGVLILILWFASDHIATRENLNILWAIPTHMVFVFFRNKRSWLVRGYFFLTAIISFLVLILWKLLPQGLNEAFVPILLIIVLKSSSIVYRCRK